MQDTSVAIAAAQPIVNDIQKNLDALSSLGSTCSVIFTWGGATHKLDGVAGSEFGARVERWKSCHLAPAAIEKKGKTKLAAMEETAALLQDESERLRAIFSAISMFSRSDEPHAMRDIEKLADIGRCSSTEIECFGQLVGNAL